MQLELKAVNARGPWPCTITAWQAGYDVLLPIGVGQREAGGEPGHTEMVKKALAAARQWQDQM
jgi:hypothetical protein